MQKMTYDGEDAIWDDPTNHDLYRKPLLFKRVGWRSEATVHGQVS